MAARPPSARPRLVAALSLLLAACGIVGYLVLSHWVALHAAQQPWAVAALLAPIWCVYAVAALRRRSVVGIALCGLAAAVVAFIVAHGGVGDIERLYVSEYVAIHLALGSSFAATLRGGPGSLSLIEGIARRVHGRLTPDMQAYARRVTKAWVAYFFAMAAICVAVYMLASWSAWAFFANALTPAGIVGLFVGEHLMRYRLHPEFERATLMDSVRAYRHPRLGTPR